MGYQIIQQPGSDLFGVFSSITGTLVMWDATHTEVVDLFVEFAAERARADTERIVSLVEQDKTREAYHQFAMTWDEIVEEDRVHKGKYSCHYFGGVIPGTTGTAQRKTHT